MVLTSLKFNVILVVLPQYAATSSEGNPEPLLVTPEL